VNGNVARALGLGLHFVARVLGGAVVVPETSLDRRSR
jgi:hypothetical protein